MFNLKEMQEKARIRGYELHMKKEDNSEYHFIKRDNGMQLKVYPNNDEFQLFYVIEPLVQLQDDKSESFMDDEHFKFREQRIEKYLDVLIDGLKETHCRECFNYNIGDGIDDISRCHECEYR